MTSFFVKRPVFSLVVFLITLIAGLFSLSDLPVDLFPKFSVPTISIMIRYPGASPEDIEKNLVDVVEREMSVIENLDDITSTSQPGVGVITLRFKHGTDMDRAVSDVKEHMNFIRPDLPEDVLEPLIFKFDASQFPVIVAAVSSDHPAFDLRYWVEEFMGEELQKAEGVGAVTLFGGGRKRQVNVFVDRVKLEGYGLTYDRIARMLQVQGVDVPAGEISTGNRQFTVRVPSSLKDVEDLKGAIVGYVGGRPVRLEEVAEVEDGYAKRRTYAISGDREVVFFAVRKQADANAVDVADAVKEKFKELEQKYPVKFTVFSDGSRFIRTSVANLGRTLLIAIGVVVLITLIFLMDWRASLIVALTIPASLVISFVYLKMVNSSLNMISLSALAIAVGSVVDAAIVVVENVFFHRLRGEPPREASIFATGEVAGAITAATITNFVVLVPLLFVPGFVGVMFKELAVISIIVYATSLFLALTVVPSFSANQLKLSPKSEPRWFIPIERAYNRALGVLIGRKTLSVPLFLLLLVCVGYLWRFVPVEFFPKLDEGFISVSLQLERGTSLDKTFKTLKPLYDSISSLPEVERVAMRVGPTEKGFGALFGTTEASYTGEISVRLKPLPQRKRGVEEVASRIEEMVGNVPGLEEYRVSTTGHATELLMGGGRGVSVEIYGEDLKVLDSLAAVFREVFGGVEGIRSITVSRGKPVPEVIFNVDRERAHSYGITPFQVAEFLRYSLEGRVVFNLKTGGKNLPVFITLSPEDRKSLEDILSLSVPTPFGPVPLFNFVSMEERLSSVRIDRKNRIRYVEISAEPSGRPLGEIRRDLQKRLSSIPLPTGYYYRLGGGFEQQAESFRQLGVLLLLAVLIIYLTISAQFESFRQGLIIFLTSVPFGLAGASLGFLVLGKPFSTTAFVGLIALVGVVVNNSIVLVDYANILRRRGRGLKEAAVEASTRRLRPVLMSALTTALGVLPLAVIEMEGSKFWEGLGVALSGGLLFSLITTLVVVPVVYTILSPSKISRAPYP